MSDFGFYFSLGWEHIISWNALDHQLFILSLAAIYLLRDWRQVLVLVTAFTVGHSLTLALTVFNVIHFPSNWIEFLIPCTIIVTAASNLFQRNFYARSIRINYFLALFFGLIHGMGFANKLRYIIAEDQSIGWSLFGFNAGLEVGQIAVVIVILIVSFLIVQLLRVERAKWVVLTSLAAFIVAAQMAVERWP
ncbi:MAG TPA: HupE/UreJ family protein [Chitinophagaceae bacterium]|nr:HupE/UreJ family protein [Chitinophagaceae bacterium]